MLVTSSTSINSVLITSVTVLDSKSISRRIAPLGSDDVTPLFLVSNYAMSYGIMLAVRLRCQVLNTGGITSDGTRSHSAPAHSAGALAKLCCLWQRDILPSHGGRLVPCQSLTDLSRLFSFLRVFNVREVLFFSLIV